MAINITKIDLIWSYFSLFLLNGVNILLLPFILTFLNSEEVGLWYTFTAVSGLVMLLDFGFRTTLSRNITYVWEGSNEINKNKLKSNISLNTEPNYFLFIKLFKATKLIYFILGLIIIVILFTLGTWYVYSVSKNDLPIETVLISWFLYAISVFLNMRFAYWNAILKGIGAIKENHQVLVITKLSQLVLTITGILLGYGLIAVALAYLISIIINRVLAHVKFYSYKNNKENIKHLMKLPTDNSEIYRILKTILPNAYRQGLISISNYINLRSTTLISSAFLGLNITASLGLVLQIINLIITVANTFFNTYLPQFGSYRIRKDFKSLELKFKKAILISTSIIFVSFLAVIFMGTDILNLMNSNTQLLPIEYLIVIMCYMFLYNNQSVFGTFIATNNELPHYKAFITSSILILIIQFILLTTLEPTLWSILLPILGVQITYNNWRWPLKVVKEFKEYKMKQVKSE